MSGLPTDGRTLYVRLWSLVGTWQYRDYTVTAYLGTSASPLANLVNPVPASTLTGSSVAFSWDTGTGVTAYHLYVGTGGVGSADLFSQNTGTVRSSTVNGLPTGGRTLYIRLWSLAGTWQYRDYTVTSSSGTSPLANLLNPAPSSTLSGAAVSFAWDTGTGVTAYHLYVGSGGVGSSNLFSQNTGTVRAATVNGLPIDGRVLYVRLWSLAGTWQYRDYTVTAASNGASPLANLLSPAPSSTLTSSSTTFSWDAGIGTAGYHIYVGSTGVGSSNLFSQNTGTARTVSVSGLPTDGRTLYVRLWSLIGSWQSRDYVLTAASN